MKTINFAKRNFKEIIRDPLSIIFAILLPLFLLFIFQQFKIPNEIYNINNFTPGIIIFSFSFITMFTAVLISKDKSSSLLIRLSASPMKPYEYILGYVLSVIPLAILQNILFYIVALFLGLEFSISVLFVILISIPLSLLFIFLGILIGSISTDKSSAGISSIVVQLVAFTSGMYFSADMIGSLFTVVTKILPFSSCLDILKGVLLSTEKLEMSSLLIVGSYIIFFAITSIIVFKRKMISDNKN